MICPLAKVSIPSYPITGQLDIALEPVNRRQVKETALQNHLARQRLAEQSPVSSRRKECCLRLACQLALNISNLPTPLSHGPIP